MVESTVKENAVADKNKQKDTFKEELSEEDLKKMEELELMVERLSDPDPVIVKSALTMLGNEIRTSTSSMTAVPKPLKFLRPHFSKLVKIYESWEKCENKILLADVMSILSMTIENTNRDSLRYRLEGTSSDIGVWGHEHLCHLAGEIIEEYEIRNLNGEPVDDLLNLVDEIIPYNIRNHSELDACDLLIQVGRIEKLREFTDERNYRRICLYLLVCSQYDVGLEGEQILQLIEEIYLSFGQTCRAMQVAIKLKNTHHIINIFDSAKSLNERRQLAFILAKHHLFNVIDLSKYESDDQLAPILKNQKLSSYFMALCKDLKILEAKELEDIYKSHLSESRGGAKLESAKLNMASSFVNGFVNAASGTDKLMTQKDKQWLGKNKENGLLVATASLGLIYLWNYDDGLGKIDPYLYSQDDYIKAGAILGVGVMMAGVRSEFDPVLNVASDGLTHENPLIRSSAALSLAIGYAGSNDKALIQVLHAALQNHEQPLDVLGQFSLAIGLVALGSGNHEVAMTLSEIYQKKGIKAGSTDASYLKLVAIGIGLLFLGMKDSSEPIIQVIQALSEHNPPVLTKTASLIIESFSYATTGNPLDVQRMFGYCSEHLESDDEFQGIAVLGLACIVVGEEIGVEMVQRLLEQLLRYGELPVRRAIPLALALISMGDSNIAVLDLLSKHSHDHDAEIAQAAILALGFVAVGSNNSRVAQMLRQLATYYSREHSYIYFVRLAQGLLHLGKGTINMQPFRMQGVTVNLPALAAIFSFIFIATDLSLLSRLPQLIFILTIAFNSQILMTLDQETLEPKPVPVRVGMAVDVVGQAGKPKTITGFQTHTSPVILSYKERAELASEQFIADTDILEGFVILKHNPEARPEKGVHK